MIDPNMIQYHVNEVIQHIMHMDKETLISCIYPVWLYIIMDGATRSSSPKLCPQPPLVLKYPLHSSRILVKNAA